MAALQELMLREQTEDPSQRASVQAQKSPGWTKPVKRTLADVMKGVDSFANDMLNPDSGMDILKWIDQRPGIANWLTMNMTPPGQMIQGSMDVSEAIQSDAPWQNRLAQGAAGVLGMATAPLGVDTRLAGTAARGLNKLDDLARSGELMRPLQNEYGVFVGPGASSEDIPLSDWIVKGGNGPAMSIDDPDLKNAPWYHGSHEDKPITKESFKQGNPDATYPGFWMTKDRDFAESYAKGKPENTYRISLANDLDLLGQYQGKDVKKRVRMAAKDAFSRGEIGPEEYRQFVSELDALSRGEISLKDNNPLDNPTVQEVLSEQGFAGAIDNKPSGQTGVLFDPYYSVDSIDPVIQNAPWRQR